jgi:hypothetical protein
LVQKAEIKIKKIVIRKEKFTFGGRDSFVGVGGLATTTGFFFTTMAGF